MSIQILTFITLKKKKEICTQRKSDFPQLQNINTCI